MTALALALAIAGMAGLTTGAQNGPPLAVGATVPDVRVTTLDGAPVALGEWIGRKPVIVEIWATWCGVCKALLPQIAAAHEKYGDRVEFLIIAIPDNETPDDVRAYMADPGLHGRVLWDADRSAMRAFGVGGTGYVFLMNAKGRVVHAAAGPKQDLDAAIARLLSGDR